MKMLFASAMFLSASLGFALEINEKVSSDPLVIVARGSCVREQGSKVKEVSFYNELVEKECHKQSARITVEDQGNGIIVTVYNSSGIAVNSYHVNEGSGIDLFTRMYALASKLNRGTNSVVFKVDRNSFVIQSINANFDSLE